MNLVKKLQRDFPETLFVTSDKPRWAPADHTVFFNPNKKNADWSLLHETGHMLANHTSYDSDIDLLKMEVEAWQKAKELGTKYGVNIDNDHIEDCLDSYRDWLYKRSLCPACELTGLEQQPGIYSCINCGKKWRVSEDRFTRVYRKTKTPA